MIQPGNGSAAASLSRPWAEYDPGDGAFDEAFSEGRIRSHWEALAQALDQLGPDELRLRQENARRILREHGAIHNVHGDNQGMDRPFDLDLVPFILPSDEWSALEQALLQRTRLLNLLLADLYGERRSIEAEVLPPAVVQANPLFLRPCNAIRPPGGVFLLLHAIDLARAPDGRWWVLADHAQAPSGLAYAIENRGVISRLLAEPFRESPVLRLEPFVRFMIEALRRFGPGSGEPSNVLTLAEGPSQDDYFEHAYLARHLGLPLIEGEDMTVRGDRVFLKTLSGLQRVHVILRRLGDTQVDPLELDPASKVGVPGLLEAARAGNIAIANAPGSGLVEAPAFLAFLPGLCRFLLGEDLLLPSVATWWCGQANERDYVLRHLDRLMVRPAFAASGADRVIGPVMAEAEWKRLAAAVSEAPRRYVGQEQVGVSRVPTMTPSGLVSWPMRFRAYVCWSGEKGMVLPGGLTRVWNPAAASMPVILSGGASKDTWVLSPTPVDSGVGGAPWAAAPVAGVRVRAEIPSRTADNLFWLGRYIERLEDTVRVLRCALARLLGETRYENSPELTAVAHLLMRLDLLPSAFAGRFEVTTLEREILALVHQTHRLGTVRDIVGRLWRVALVVRDRFSIDTWRIFNKLQSDPSAHAGGGEPNHAMQLLNSLVFNLAAFSGMQMENMTRGSGWRILDLGRRLERAVNMITLSQAALHLDALDQTTAELILEIADSAMTYRRRYFAAPQTPPAFELLWVDGSNPRSLVYQLDAVAGHLARLPEDFASAWSLPGSDALERGRTTLRALNLEALAAPHALDPSSSVARVIADIARDLRLLSDALAQRHFGHSPTRCSSK